MKVLAPINTIKVKVSELYPGCHDIDVPKLYFPRLIWGIYEVSISFLFNYPECSDPCLPIYHVWKDYVKHTQGGVPDEGSEARYWRWEHFSTRLRELVRSLQERGFDEELTRAHEKIKASISSENKICVKNGNKRVAYLRLTQPNKELEIEIV